MTLRQFSFVLAGVIVAACGPSSNQRLQAHPAPVSTPTAPVAVNASYTHTWDSVVELLAHDWGVAAPRPSGTAGVAQTDMVKLDKWSADQRAGIATCDRLDPDVVWLSILVHGDSARSTVEFTPQYFRWNGSGWLGCPTTGKWEHTLAVAVKARAEGLER